MALEHVLDLLPRAHEETRAANRKQVAEGVARGELLYPDVRTEEIAKEVDWVSGSLKDGQAGKAGRGVVWGSVKARSLTSGPGRGT